MHAQQTHHRSIMRQVMTTVCFRSTISTSAFRFVLYYENKKPRTPAVVNFPENFQTTPTMHGRVIFYIRFKRMESYSVPKCPIVLQYVFRQRPLTEAQSPFVMLYIWYDITSYYRSVNILVESSEYPWTSLAAHRSINIEVQAFIGSSLIEQA